MATIDERSTRLAQELDAAATLNEPWESVIERHLREVARDQRIECAKQLVVVPQHPQIMGYVDHAQARTAVLNAELK